MSKYKVEITSLVENRAFVHAWPAHLSRFGHQPCPKGAYVPVHAPCGPAGPREAFAPVRMGSFVPVGSTNREQWASLLDPQTLDPVLGRNWDKCVLLARRCLISSPISTTSPAEVRLHLFISVGCCAHIVA